MQKWMGVRESGQTVPAEVGIDLGELWSIRLEGGEKALESWAGSLNVRPG